MKKHKPVRLSTMQLDFDNRKSMSEWIYHDLAYRLENPYLEILGDTIDAIANEIERGRYYGFYKTLV